MGGSNLNLKKSWHPTLLKNQEQVWNAEQLALKEKKKIEELRKQLQEERTLLEMQKMQDASSGTKRKDIVEWMYQTPNAPGTGKESVEMEEYLLGRKPITEMFKNEEKCESEKFDDKIINPASRKLTSQKDEVAKLRDDPLFAIKREEDKRLRTALLLKNQHSKSKRPSQDSQFVSGKRSERYAEQSPNNHYRSNGSFNGSSTRDSTVYRERSPRSYEKRGPDYKSYYSKNPQSKNICKRSYFTSDHHEKHYSIRYKNIGDQRNDDPQYNARKLAEMQKDAQDLENNRKRQNNNDRLASFQEAASSKRARPQFLDDIGHRLYKGTSLDAQLKRR